MLFDTLYELMHMFGLARKMYATVLKFADEIRNPLCFHIVRAAECTNCSIMT